ncbi:hypothetical protein [Asticcacaulis machinosus]|uniref:Uncharacterized protein n=1 Tax=Asticcacaulis machinosus TaxID=2984211 RepID=A0ABT5HIC7_9CAUL|nr:hypothetical protein [Asticcacaulis machinosus]MDC7675996.1 hypothetical protein [Asticcacaulis machinosus]
MARTSAILTHAILRRPHIVLRRVFGLLNRRDYHLAMLVFLSVFIFAFVANS